MIYLCNPAEAFLSFNLRVQLCVHGSNGLRESDVQGWMVNKMGLSCAKESDDVLVLPIYKSEHFLLPGNFFTPNSSCVITGTVWCLNDAVLVYMCMCLKARVAA